MSRRILDFFIQWRGVLADKESRVDWSETCRKLSPTRFRPSVYFDSLILLAGLLSLLTGRPTKLVERKYSGEFSNIVWICGYPSDQKIKQRQLSLIASTSPCKKFFTALTSRTPIAQLFVLTPLCRKIDWNFYTLSPTEFFSPPQDLPNISFESHSNTLLRFSITSRNFAVVSAFPGGPTVPIIIWSLPVSRSSNALSENSSSGIPILRPWVPI